MSNRILGIDHPVIGVAGMAAARTTYERLGFAIPPRGSHIEWGTGNWCIMFGDDYLELRGILDPDKYTHGLDEFLAAGEGLMGGRIRHRRRGCRARRGEGARSKPRRATVPHPKLRA